MSKVWVLTWGTWGDHEPAAALAQGLQAAGHPVTVFGGFRFRRRFEDLKIKFSPIDGLTVLHPANSEARKVLQKQASEAGFDGPEAIEKYLFDLVMEWLDYVDWLSTTPGRMGEITGLLTALKTFILTGQGLEYLPAGRPASREFLAARVGKSMEEYLAHVRKRNAAYWQFFERIEDKTHMSPFDAMQSWRGTFQAYLSKAVEAVPDKDKMDKLGELMRSFHEWEDSTNFEAALDKHWNDWSPKFAVPEGWETCGRTLMEANLLALQNMQFYQREAFSTPDKPDAVVCHAIMMSSAADLSNRGILTVGWWTTPPPKEIKGLLSYYQSILPMELGLPGDKPLLGTGPFKFLDVWFGKKLLIGMSSITLHDYPPYRQHLLPHCTGKWVLEGGSAGGKAAGSLSALSAELEAFLKAHEAEPPVYFGWGSMLQEPVKLSCLVVETLKKLGRAGVFVGGASGVTSSALEEAFKQVYKDKPDQVAEAKARICFQELAPHELLLPRVACAVHHGGMGTCGAVLRAGVPQVVVPCAVDQFGNGEMIKSLGCGATGPELKNMEADGLAALVKQVLENPQCLVKAKELREQVLQEGGVAKAVQLIEKYVQEGPSPAPSGPSLAPGVYQAFTADGQPRPGPRWLVAAEGTLYKEASPPEPVGLVQGGAFVLGNEVEGAKPGEYDLRMAWVSDGNVMYGKMSKERTRVTVSDGAYMELAS